MRTSTPQLVAAGIGEEIRAPMGDEGARGLSTGKAKLPRSQVRGDIGNP